MASKLENIEDSAEKLFDMIEKDLAGMKAESHNVSDDELTEWKIKYSTKFHELMERHPDLLALYASDREKALEEIDKELYTESE